jgi:transposase InsO family protein
VNYSLEKKAQCQFSEDKIAEHLGISRRKFYKWKQALGQEWKVGVNLPKSHYLEEWEKDAIVSFYEEHEQDGYRRCAYMMMDRNIVFAAPSTVYSVLKSRDAMRRKGIKVSKKGTGFEQPLPPHEHWHSDITNVSVGDTVYFLISILDGFSRSIIAWDLRDSMKYQDVGIVFERAKELFPNAKPRCISDNGSQYKCKEFTRFIKRNDGYTHVTTSPYYPQSNGKQERFHGNIKRECIRLKCPLTKQDAETVIGEYIEYYNKERLHSAIGYISPHDKLNGKSEAIHQERDKKLNKRRKERR